MTAAVDPPRHLLVRLPGPLGDAVLATPALRGLRQALPGTRITWAGGRAPLAALEGLDDRDDVLPVAGRFARGLRGPFRVGRMWRRVGPDAVLLLPHSWSATIAARRCGARQRIGSKLRGRGWLLTRTVALPREGRRLAPRSMVQMYLDLAAPLGALDDGRPPRVVTRPFDDRRAARRLADTGDQRLLAVNPGAGFGSSKIYPPDRLGAAIDRIRRETGTLPLILCGPGEEALARETARSAGPPLLSTAEDPPDIGELKALLARSSVLLTTDAGPRHLAEALGVPTVVLMGPTDPRWSEPTQAQVLRRDDLPCIACHAKTCPLADHPCLSQLDPARVAAAVEDALGPP